MMKTILLAACLTICLQLYSQVQKRNSFGISAGIGRPDYLMPVIGGRSVDGRGFELGVNYYRQITRKIKLESGMVWHLYQLTTSSDYPQFAQNYYEFGLLYIPVMMRLNFSNHFFMNTGLLADVDLRTEPAIKNQTGLGAGLGFGFEMPISGKLIVQINPYFNMHSLWVVKDNINCDCFPSGLLERGIRVGIRTR
jgi:hypothetical protein